MTVRQFLDALRYTMGSGYPTMFVMGDGAAMCPRCAYRERFRIARAIRDGDRDGWRAEAHGVYWEGPPEDCCECTDPIESAYGDPESDDPTECIQ